MVNQTIKCYHCGSDDLKKNGKASNGKQRYHCKDCGRASRENGDYGYSEARREEILRAYQERSNMRGISRTFGIARNTLASWLKKAKTLLALKDTLLTPNDPAQVSLELDELWSFVKKKSNKRWVWLALCKQTLQVVASVVGGRGIETCKHLWANVPECYKQGMIFSDFWDSYQAVIPDEQHRAVGKESGLTAHIERFNNTLRQRLARFVRKTLSFSKSDHMLLICLHSFLVRYNLDILASSSH